MNIQREDARILLCIIWLFGEHNHVYFNTDPSILQVFFWQSRLWVNIFLLIFLESRSNNQQYIQFNLPSSSEWARKCDIDFHLRIESETGH